MLWYHQGLLTPILMISLSLNEAKLFLMMTDMNQPLIPITRQQALLFALFLVIFEFSTYISNDMIMPAMLAVTQSFKVSPNNVPTAMTAFILGGACWQLFLGPISDRFGRRIVMLIGAVLFILCTVGITFASSMDAFILGRFLQGAGLCFTFVIGYAAIQEIFSEKAAIQLIALMANVAMIAPLIGPVAGAWYIHYAPWQGIFWIIAVIALIGFMGLYRYMPETIGVVKRDGSITPPHPLELKKTICNYLHLCKDRVFMLGVFSMTFNAIVLLIWIALAPLILINHGGLTTIQYGWSQIPVFAAIIAGNLILRHLTEKMALVKIVVLSSSIMLLGLIIGMIWLILQHGYFLGMVVGVSIYSLGFGIGNAVLYRQTLFANQTSKGTVSAVISIVTMLMFGLSIELSKILYSTPNNILLGIIFVLIGMLYTLIVWRFQRGLPATP